MESAARKPVGPIGRRGWTNLTQFAPLPGKIGSSIAQDRWPKPRSPTRTTNPRNFRRFHALPVVTAPTCPVAQGTTESCCNADTTQKRPHFPSDAGHPSASRSAFRRLNNRSRAAATDSASESARFFKQAGSSLTWKNSIAGRLATDNSRNGRTSGSS